ncbi:homoserine dehydrogenase [Alphaproteobacteria bacterium]|nr:homoserine dehydrogenase [Alphaproteobacteria bacterium]
MSELRIGIAGLGVVGAETAKQIITAQTMLCKRAGADLKIVAVSARDKEKDRGFSLQNIIFYTDPLKLLEHDDIDLIVELIGGEQGIALSLVEGALNAGKHVVTANKAMIAHHGFSLAALAEVNNVSLQFEAAVAGGIPAIKILREGLAGNAIQTVVGILNGTCNYILSEMTSSKSAFQDVLKEAQSKGFAEADPSFDIDGIDAAHKLAILSAIAFGQKIPFSSLAITGIRQVSDVDISYAGELGYCLKLLGIAHRDKAAEVSMALIPADEQLASVNGSLNAVSYSGTPVQSCVCIGPGAGAGPTSSAVLADIIDVASGLANFAYGIPVEFLAEQKIEHHKSSQQSYYLRLSVTDKPGVLSEISAILKDHDLSVASMIQNGQSEDGPVFLVFTTHKCAKAEIEAAVQIMQKSEHVLNTPMVIPIFDTGSFG